MGGLPARVGHGVVHDPKARIGHEVGVAVIGIADGGKPPLLARDRAEADPGVQLTDLATLYGQV